MFRWPHVQRAPKIHPDLSPVRRRYGQKELVTGEGFTELHGRRPKILSYGGGLDSFCILLSALEAGSPPDRIVFMDVGNPHAHVINVGDEAEPGEWPETYDHILEVVAPLARKHGIPFHWITADWPTGRMKKRLADAGVTVEVYPIRPPQSERAKLSQPAYGLWQWFLLMNLIATRDRKLCTEIAKIERFEEWLADMYPGEQAELWIGFEKGEEYRQHRGKAFALEGKAGGQGRKSYMVQPYVEYPLISWYDLTREDCAEYVASRGFPVPKKSACMGCIFNRPTEWMEYAETYPRQFAKTVSLEKKARKTEAGFPFAQVFKKFGLSRAQYRLMEAIESGLTPPKFGGREKKSFEVLVRNKWASKSGKLTKHGRAILEAARVTPPPEKGDSVAVVERAAGVVKDAKGNVIVEGKPILGVHYSMTPLDEWVEKLRTDPELVEEMRGEIEERRALLPPGELTRRRNPACAPVETAAFHLDAHGRPPQDEWMIAAFDPETRQDYGYAEISVFGNEAQIKWLEVRKECRAGWPLGGVHVALAEAIDEWARANELLLTSSFRTPEGDAMYQLVSRTKLGREARERGQLDRWK